MGPMTKALIEEKAKHMLNIGNTNDKLFNINIHIAYLKYTEKEVEAKNVFRLTKLEWLAAGMPVEPIEIVART